MTDYLQDERVKAARALVSETIQQYADAGMEEERDDDITGERTEAARVASHNALDALCEAVAAVSGPEESRKPEVPSAWPGLMESGWKCPKCGPLRPNQVTNAERCDLCGADLSGLARPDWLVPYIREQLEFAVKAMKDEAPNFKEGVMFTSDQLAYHRKAELRGMIHVLGNLTGMTRHEGPARPPEGEAWIERKLAEVPEPDSGVAAGGGSLPSCLTCGKVGDPSTVHMPSGVYVCTTCIATLRAARPQGTAAGDVQKDFPLYPETGSHHDIQPENTVAIERIDDLADLIRQGIYGDDRQTMRQAGEAVDALNDLVEIALRASPPSPGVSPSPLREPSETPEANETLAALDKAINWLMGCEDSFEPSPDATKRRDGSVAPYWYRSEFAKRAGIVYNPNTSRYHIIDWPESVRRSALPVDTSEAVRHLTRPADDFYKSFDARVWAKAWLDIVKEHPEVPTDEGTMIGWFANALMRGYDEYHWTHPAPPVDTGDRERIDWLEAQHGLHSDVEITYVVDGYTVDVMDHDGATCVSTNKGATLRAAIDAAREAK
jgi:hypothetical protein